MYHTPGTQIGPYRIIKALGAGNAGSVYAAINGEREVALKVRTRQQHSPKEGFLEGRFREGARLLGWLSHPHIVWQYEHLELEEYQAVALEYLGGGTLSEHLKRSALLNERSVCAIGFSLCDALDHLHELGVIHRDLKPENILLDTSPLWGDTGLPLTPKLADFDVSKHPILSPNITESGSHVGTLWYTSPEQFDQGSPSPSDDVYSLGVTLYECATRALPFEPLNSSSVFRRFLDHHPLPSLRGARPEFSASLEWIIERAAESKLSLRVPTASTLAVLLMGASPQLARTPRAHLMQRRAHKEWIQSQLRSAPSAVQAQLSPSLEALGVT